MFDSHGAKVPGSVSESHALRLSPPPAQGLVAHKGARMVLAQTGWSRTSGAQGPYDKK